MLHNDGRGAACSAPVVFALESARRGRRHARGFKRIALQPSERASVRLTVKASDLAYWSVAKGAWEVEADQIDLMVGGSSADVKLRTRIRVDPWDGDRSSFISELHRRGLPTC